MRNRRRGTNRTTPLRLLSFMTEETSVDRSPLVVSTDPQRVWKAFLPGIIVGALLIPVTAILAVGFAAWMGDNSGFVAGTVLTLSATASSSSGLRMHDTR